MRGRGSVIVGLKHLLTFGHETMGIIEEVGDKITTLKKGDCVLVGAGIGEITDFGEIGEGFPGEPLSYGIGDYEPGAPVLDGGQAQFMRVPFANGNLLILPREVNTSWIISSWQISGLLLGMHWNVRDKF